jgi:hypothetical protein
MDQSSSSQSLDSVYRQIPSINHYGMFIAMQFA